MRNGKNNISVTEINRKFHELCESNDDLITRDGSIQDFYNTVAKHKETKANNLLKKMKNNYT